ncbi:secondary thiamine-phosphate synthase enzyme YjbQ [Thiococcus pfennigii]|jgi:secondary thiamine-phosphate synthase enzyme|uniref:secondary thiamine-phosphate synthase enzyme YjbQ n=1 Tax=Thiococcus pfennigii TaxID=1057 RepID=UPI001906FC9F|nr:secondary thiamine-phosphate synthase enzyme YjbQ [Thiococcus pfennigii]MBK1699783.1 secondary thiamine-phosphate synthase enzyme [Thiococcus pfennigii]MBK1731075.1 secondary thiamine-phosphate synthase enzyme [Thiococcus pfennigii]
MKTHQETLSLATHQPIELIDITARIKERVAASGLREGLATLISPHTTAYVNLNEREPRLQEDMLRFLQDLAPREGDYGHNRVAVDGRDNAHAHLLGLFMSASATIPLAGGELVLGTWQSIFFIELDGPRPARQVHLHLIGEA